MFNRSIVSLILLFILSVVLAGCTAAAPPQPVSEQQPPPLLVEEIPPCAPVVNSSVDPCGPVVTDDPDGDHSSGSSASYILFPELLDLRVSLTQSSVHVAHLVLRGTYLPGTVRCTSGGGRFRPPPYASDRFYPTYAPKQIRCYADVRVGSYEFGSGPPVLTVMAERLIYSDNRSPDGVDRDKANQTVDEFVEWVQLREEHRLSEGDDSIVGREAMLFIGPSVDTMAEAWEVFETRFLERQDDETVVAVRPDRYVWQSEPDYEQNRNKVEMPLAEFSTAVTAAHQARVAAYGGRTNRDLDSPMLLSNANDLSTYFRSIGVDDDPDGPPAQPPPAPVCASGTAVTNPDTNRGLMHDCSNLLEAKDTLRGTATLNWSNNLAIGSWEGLTTSGTPTRVTRVVLVNKNLTGSIAAEFSALIYLEELRLSGNSLTGCIPVALQGIETNDLGSLNLLYCAPPAPESLSAGTATRTSVPLSWSAVSDTSKFRVEYRPRRSRDWMTDDDALITTSHTVDELECGSAYQFRVSAFGSGTTYAAAWSEPSPVLLANTAECASPEFAEDAYNFEVPQDAARGDEVGTVLATDPQGDAVTYSITAGNDAGSFAVGASTGTITVAGTLNRETTPTYTLTVRASDGSNTSDVDVEITVTQATTCWDGIAAPEPGSNPGLVADCEALLAARDELRGTGTLNWSARNAMTGWDGVTLSGTPSRVTEVNPAGSSLNGGIPGALGDLSNLSTLDLSHNRLTGPIPAELGDLANLSVLELRSNSLSGSIPPELGDAGQLARLWLQNNELTGTVPGELAQLSNLSVLFLTGNNLTGCIPSSLRSVTILRVGLPDCQGALTTAPSGLAASVADGAFALTWTVLTGAGFYEPQHRPAGSGAEWATLPTVTGASATFTPEGGLVCGTTHEFRVRARGNGMTHVASWTAFSSAVSQETGSCNTPPAFAEPTYAFTVSEAAPVGHAVGMVSATDADTGDTLTYSITAGNDAGVFAIGGSAGEITLAGALDYDVASAYTLTVQADDGNGGTATAAVEVSVADALEEVELWSGTMTAAEFALGNTEAHGYTAGVMFQTFDTGVHGSLDGATFVYGGETYTVQLATHYWALLVPARDAFLIMLEERRLPADTTLALLVDGQRLEEFQTEGLPRSDGLFYYRTYDLDFAFAPDQVVSLSLLKTNPSADSGLASLALSGVTVSPAFDGATHAYTASVSNGVPSVTVTAAANSEYGSVSVSSGGVTGGSGAEVALVEGENTVTVTVTAEDQTATDYVIVVTREAA